MKKALLFVAATICLQAHSQFPYFLQEHSGNNVNYSTLVDMEFDGSGSFFSLHASNPGPGALITRYDAITGGVLNVSYLTRGNAPIKPTRVRTFGGNHYVLFNTVSGAGVAGYCLVSINSGAYTVNWAHAFAVPAGTRRYAVDFIIDGGGTFAYILSNAYDLANNQTDLAVTAVNLTIPGFTWDNVYQNLARNEDAGNIIYDAATNELIVSAISADLLNPVIDRGPMLMRLTPGTGGYLASMLYEYTPGCTHAEPAGTWVVLEANNFYLSSTSFENGVNGPLWLSEIDPPTLGINMQSNHQTNTVYLNPEINVVQTTTGLNLLLSGPSPAASGYVHTEFNTSALAFAQGVYYPSTNPQTYGRSIFDAYNSTGIGMNIFSVAENAASPARYYLLKTDDLGRNDCDDPYTVTPDPCLMNPLGINFTTIPVILTNGPVICSISNRSNTITQTCFVPFMATPDPRQKETRSTIGTELTASPNPTRGIFTLSAGKSILSDVYISNADGKQVSAEISETTDGLSVNLSGKKAGMYVIQVLVDGEPKNLKVILE